MSEYLLGIVGILVSIGLFLLGYRQTIGAKRERTHSANSEIEKMLVRRIVLDGYEPRLEDIGRLIDGKARDFRVRPSDLLSEGQLLNNVFTRVVETDFIPADKREEVLNRMTPIIAEADEQPKIEADDNVPSEAASRKLATMMMAMMGVLASLAGTLVSVLPEIRDVPAAQLSELLPFIVGTAAASLTVISFLILIYRIRDRQQEAPSKTSSLSEYVDFERDVVNAFKKAGIEARIAGPQNRGFDLSIQRGGRKILVEVKSWKRPMPGRVVDSVLNQLREAMAQEDAKEAILVTRSDVPTKGALGGDDRIKIMTLRDLQSYLSQAA